MTNEPAVVYDPLTKRYSMSGDALCHFQDQIKSGKEAIAELERFLDDWGDVAVLLKSLVGIEEFKVETIKSLEESGWYVDVRKDSK